MKILSAENVCGPTLRGPLHKCVMVQLMEPRSVALGTIHPHAASYQSPVGRSSVRMSSSPYQRRATSSPAPTSAYIHLLRESSVVQRPYLPMRARSLRLFLVVSSPLSWQSD